MRLVAATNRDLETMIENREFRSDLYYRLNVFPIRIPPLRERPEDIPLLVRYFAQKYGRRMEKQIESVPATAMKKLSSWHWPGNIRELENFIERSVILTHGTALQVAVSELTNGTKALLVSATRNSGERDEILRILKSTNGRVAGPDGAAVRMGLKRTTLISRMKKLGIDPRQVAQLRHCRDFWRQLSPYRPRFFEKPALQQFFLADFFSRTSLARAVLCFSA